MRVLVDALNCKPDQGGIRTYTKSVCRELARRDQISLIVVTSTVDFDGLRADVIRAPLATRSARGRAIWRERYLAGCIRSAAADVVFSPTPELPIRQMSVPAVMVVHDVGPAVAPDLYGRKRWIRYHSLLPRALKRATTVVCVSEATRIALGVAFDVRERCVVIGEGAPDVEPRCDEASAGMPTYVLYVGSLYQHKNLPTLARAWASNDALSHLQLRVVGPTDDARGISRLRSAAEEAGVDLIVEGFVSSAGLAQLHRHAAAVALPSLYEGFGLTALEALTYGAPLVASAIPAVAEVVGDAAVLVSEPTSPVAWGDALVSVISDNSRRADLRTRGVERAMSFSWAAVATQLEAVMQEAAA
jgi:glycosyltransferase involved in cell wall biosynthesis